MAVIAAGQLIEIARFRPAEVSTSLSEVDSGGEPALSISGGNGLAAPRRVVEDEAK
jgi:hypothetical protein